MSRLSRFPLAALVLLLAVVVLLLAFSVDWFGQTLRVSDKSEPIKLESMANYTGAVIFLHGLGDTGNEDYGVASTFNNIRLPHIKYVFPTAEKVPVAMNHGQIMNSWFNLFGLEPTSDEDEASIEAAAKRLQALIAEQESLGIKRDRIVVGGLSQGGATSLYSLLTISQKPVAGIIGLSTWLPLHKKFPKATKANLETPILLCHGDADSVVSLDFAKLTAETLKAVNRHVEFNIYPGLPHWVDDKEMKDVSLFINKCLSR